LERGWLAVTFRDVPGGLYFISEEEDEKEELALQPVA
jgi:hypothetical protein